MTEFKRPNFFRRKLLIYKPIQIELFKIVFWSNIISTFVATLASIGFIYTVSRLSVQEESTFMSQALTYLSNFYFIYFIYLIVGVTFILALIFYAWLRVSHSIAGPIYKIKLTLENYLASGVYTKIILRKTDKLKEVAELVNSAVEKESKN